MASGGVWVPRVNCYGPTTYSARIPTCRLRTTADAVYVTVRLRYRAQCEVGRVAKEGARVCASARAMAEEMAAR